MNLRAIFQGVDQARIGVVGDFCLDVYWLADMKRSVLSRETPHYPLPVVEERMSPGGAGNVACNISALKPKALSVFGVVGRDLRGQALRELLSESGADTSGLFAVPAWTTNAYIKPLRSGISETVYEDPRLDFENYRPLPREAEERLLDALQSAKFDVLCVCDQMRFGCVTPRVRERICDMGRQGARILVDSRERIAEYKNVIIKPNEVEAAAALGIAAPAGDGYEEIALRLSQNTRRPALVTLGDRGCIVCENGKAQSVPACRVEKPVDICGAGDTFMSALSCAIAAGVSLAEAAGFANTACAVTVKKLHTTGTASRQEIEALWSPRAGTEGAFFAPKIEYPESRHGLQ